MTNILQQTGNPSSGRFNPETSQVFGVSIPGAGLAPRSVMPNGASVDITTLFSGNLVGNGGGLRGYWKRIPSRDGFHQMMIMMDDFNIF